MTTLPPSTTTTEPMTITSKLAVCKTVFGVINGVQTEPYPAHRIAGIAATLILACRAKGLDISEVMNGTERVLKDAEVYAPETLRAAQMYVRNEL